MKKMLSISIAVATMLSMTSCTKSNETATTDSSTTGSAATDSAVIDNKGATILRLSHFWPSTAVVHTDIMEPWAQKIESDSNGRLKVEIYPSASLSKPNATYDAVAKGTVDIGTQVLGYVSGRFPLSEIAELPGMSNSSSELNCILHDLYDNGVISSEYEDTHLLFMMGAGPGALHTMEKPIRKPDDMKGMRIRRPSVIAGNIIETAGGIPVGLPAPDIYTSLQRNVIDGLSFPWDAVGSFRLLELVKTHTNIPLYSSAITLTMNKDKYNALSDDLKKVLDDNSGVAMSKNASNVFDTADEKFLTEAKAHGNTIIEIPDPLNDPEWSGTLNTVIQNYLEETQALGLDADRVYEKAKEASVACKS